MMTSRPSFLASARAAAQISTGVSPGRLNTGHLDALAEHLELLDGGGALHVGGDEQRLLALLLEVARELRAARRLCPSPAGRPS
jgi:hypothetical protein